MSRIVRTYHMEFDQPPEKVFPLLCPVREYDWIADWRCEMLYSESGVAELDCVFRTAFPDWGPAVWTCSRYEPARAIDYIVTGEAHLEHLAIRLAPAGSGSRLEWSRTYSAASAEGERKIAALTGAHIDGITEMLEHSLRHYLDTGQMWRPAESARTP